MTSLWPFETTQVNQAWKLSMTQPFIDYQDFTEPLPELLRASLLNLHLSVFKGQTSVEVMAEIDYYSKRTPFLLNLAQLNGQLIGYKMGYERKPGHFYSWLGCIDPAYRQQGIANALMQRQHAWCIQHGYHTVRTQTYNQWREMLIFNLTRGFDIIGTQQGAHGLLIVLEKRLDAGLTVTG